MKTWLMTIVLSAALCGCVFGSTEPHRRFVIVDFCTQQVHHWDSADSNQCFAVSVPNTWWDLKKMRDGVYRVVGDRGFKIVDLTQRRVTDTFRHPSLKGVTAVCDLPDGGFVGCVGNPHAKETRLCRFSAARELIATYHLPGIHYTRTMSNDRAPWTLLISWYSGFARVRIDPQANTCKVEKQYPLVSGRNQFDAEPDLAGTGYWASGGYGCELAHFTSDGRLLSRWKDPQNACFFAQVKEMPNGSVYLAHWTGHSMRDLSKGAQVIEFDSTGKVIWRLEDQQRFKSVIGLDVIDAPELTPAPKAPQAWYVPGWRRCGTPDPLAWTAFTNAFPSCACRFHDWEGNHGWWKSRDIADAEVTNLVAKIAALPEATRTNLTLVGHSLGGRIVARTLSELGARGLRVKLGAVLAAAIPNNDPVLETMGRGSSLPVLCLCNPEDIVLKYTFRASGEQTAALGLSGALKPLPHVVEQPVPGKIASEEEVEAAWGKFESIKHIACHHALFYLAALRRSLWGEQPKDVPTLVPQEKMNWSWKVVDAEIWWNVLAVQKGWKLEQHKVTDHCRILDVTGRRVAWGRADEMRLAFEKLVYEGKAPVPGESAVSISDDWVKYVLTEMGTVNQMGGGGCNISTGNLYPMTARPWGFGGWTPQTKPSGEESWFYDYTEPRIYGLRQTRQPSPWIGDHGAWNFLPVVGDVSDEAQNRFSWYSHKAETRGPDRYGVYLADFDTTVELAPALHGAAVRIVYPETQKPGLVVNPFNGGSVKLSDDRKSVMGVSERTLRSRTRVRQHFILTFDCVVKEARQLKDGALAVTFPPMGRGDVVNVRIASSLISAEQARVNLAETDGKRFAEVAAEARAEWQAQLSKINVTSDDLEAKRVFYTCLYRTMLFPLAVWEKTADGKIVHWSPSSNEVRPGYYYAGTGFWDTFRALFPLLNFLSPEMNAKMMEGLENCWKESGWLPEWSSPGLVNCMIGNNSASVVADAWLSGVRGSFDIQALYQALLHGANHVHPQFQAVGRCGADFYNQLGYVPRDVGIRESAARTLEYAYDDWCIARLGAALGRPKEEVDLYLKRSQNWRNVFDPARRITVGRNKDGSFKKDFNPFDWGGDFTEGCAHHYTWSVFHDVPGLMTAMGGAAAFEKRLDEIFTMPPTAGVAYYGRVIHETREMQVMNMGQYAHGNQPIQHMLYLYDWCGAWAKAQRRTREVMDRLYRPAPDGYCGDEDNGQTSAWYVWSALGLYPVCPASGSYALGAPRFDRIDVTLPNGKKLSIRAPHAETGCVFNRVSLDDRELTAPFAQKTDLDKGGKFEWSVQK